MNKKTWLGILGVVGIWLTAGLALPFVNVLRDLSPEQLMVCRGWMTALIAFILLRGDIGGVDRYSKWIAVILPLATLGLFEGIRHWGAGPTIIVITATPLVNFLVAAKAKTRISASSIIGLVLMLAGVVVARWGGTFQWAGLIWSVFGTIMNGILYELFSRAKSPSLKKCFWACAGMGTLGMLLSLGAPWPDLTANPSLVVSLIGFAFVGGFLYWRANLLAFESLPTAEASVLAQGEAPAVILMAGVLLGEHLTAVQWTGVVVALFGACYLIVWLKNNAPKELASEPVSPA